jgi:hypothetical protein
MHMTLVSEGFDMQVVGVVDVLADLQHRWQRVGRPQVGELLRDFVNVFKTIRVIDMLLEFCGRRAMNFPEVQKY